MTKLLDIWNIRVSSLRMEGSRLFLTVLVQLFPFIFVFPITESIEVPGTQAQLLFLTTI